MIRMFVVFVVLSVLIGLALGAWHALTGKAKWRLTKVAAFSTMCAALAVGLLTVFVILF